MIVSFFSHSLSLCVSHSDFSLWHLSVSFSDSVCLSVCLTLHPSMGPSSWASSGFFLTSLFQECQPSGQRPCSAVFFSLLEKCCLLKIQNTIWIALSQNSSSEIQWHFHLKVCFHVRTGERWPLVLICGFKVISVGSSIVLASNVCSSSKDHI